jgi:drug/metabolite transporter (DMT)-like permease
VHERISTTAPVRRATLVGGGAIALWSTLALFTTLTPNTPPFLLVGLTFSIAAALMAAKWLATGESILAKLRMPVRLWALGLGGLFGYHALYFLAIKRAPPLEAQLIAYLWPLLIVLFSALLPGERLRWYHAAGGVAGLIGTLLLVGGGVRLDIGWEHAVGYAAALGCALVWAGYSVVSRRFGSVSTESVGAFCAGTAVLGFLCSALFEPTGTPGGWEWVAILALGLGPAGLAFYLWDHGVKRGDIRALGALSYLAPLVSSVLLILFGRGQLTWRVVVAGLLIVGGAVLAAGDLLRRRPA